MENVQDRMERIVKVVSDAKDLLEGFTEDLEYNPTEVLLQDLLPKEHQNLRMVSALETLIQNLGYIPIAALEAFVERYNHTI